MRAGTGSHMPGNAEAGWRCHIDTEALRHGDCGIGYDACRVAVMHENDLLARWRRRATPLPGRLLPSAVFCLILTRPLLRCPTILPWLQQLQHSGSAKRPPACRWAHEARLSNARLTPRRFPCCLLLLRIAGQPQLLFRHHGFSAFQPERVSLHQSSDEIPVHTSQNPGRRSTIR